jgi:DNA-binding IscR family transcriptional regulator
MPIMQVSRKIDYALRAVIHLANEEAGDRACSVAEIASRERIRGSSSRRSCRS